ncbi:MAG: hypothetical protein WC451_02640 [Patescibacteria group bacterium]
MVAAGDIITLGFEGKGLVLDNTCIRVRLGAELLDYLNTTSEKLISGEDVLVLKCDEGKHGSYIGIGKKSKK